MFEVNVKNMMAEKEKVHRSGFGVLKQTSNKSVGKPLLNQRVDLLEICYHSSQVNALTGFWQTWTTDNNADR